MTGPCAGCELNPKYPGGALAQKARLEQEGHTVVQRGRKNLRWVVKDYEAALFPLDGEDEDAADEDTAGC